MTPQGVGRPQWVKPYSCFIKSVHLQCHKLYITAIEIGPNYDLGLNQRQAMSQINVDADLQCIKMALVSMYNDCAQSNKDYDFEFEIEALRQT